MMNSDAQPSQPDPVSRRSFLSRLSLASMSAALGAEIVFGDKMPAGLIPTALAQGSEPFTIPGKEGLSLFTDRPLVAETPAHLLDDEITPAKHLFIRNNGLPPAAETLDPEKWTLEIAGESCEKPVTFTLKELKEKFEHHTLQMVLECAGNGRSEFNPPATGTQWTTGGVGCPTWTGVRLKDVLKHVGIKPDAVYIGYYGADFHLSGNPEKSAISRGAPIAKAMEDETLIAFAMNGEDIPYQNGHPLRLMFGGWAGSTCGKWLKRILVRDREHDGEKMTGHSYRMPRYPVAPGTKPPAEDMEVIAAMPVKSLITFPISGITHPVGEALTVRGHAWTGEGDIREMHVSVDFGITWQKADLRPAANRYAWQHWTTALKLPKKGYYEIWARAQDSQGRSQPMVLPGWNPQGYLNNTCHRIAIQAV
ncbi:sulfite oxidase [Prosthecobacter sp. SYSU 5D2]|uniref:sulfite oxidase n=1 Tax=Prosthecobacter sp. SYSU 5D2 TaxID=3134134 RepID=UPI0031FEFBC1